MSPYKDIKQRRIYTKNHRETINATARKWKRKLYLNKNDLISRVGQCQKCGFNDLRALQIHHFFGSMSERRKDPSRATRDIINHKVPFAILCANCHMILHNPKKIAQRP